MEDFNDIFEDCTSLGTKIPKDEYLEEGKHIVIDQGQNIVAGYTNLEEGLFEDVPAIIFGDHTRIIKYVDKPFFLGADGVKLLKAKKENANYKYLYYALKNARIPDTGYNRHFKWLKEVTIQYPSPEKQKEVVQILDKLSSIIDARTKELVFLDELIEARFVELFGDVICNEKKWPTYTLSDISDSRLGKMLDAKQQTGEYQHPYLANFNVQWFRFDFSQLNVMDFTEADRMEFELQEGDLLVTEGGEVGRCAVWKNEVASCYFQKALHRVRCDKQIIIPDYLAWWFKQRANYNSFEDVVGGKTSIPHLTGVKLKSLKVVVPDMELQKQFVEFTKQVNKSKAAVQKSLTETQKLFDSLMQEYFG